MRNLNYIFLFYLSFRLYTILMSEFFLNYGSWIWLSILILCCIVEALTFTLTAIWAAIAAVPMIFIAKTPLPFQWQLLIFAVLTVLLIIFTRPFAVKKLKNGSVKTNVDTMVGEEVLVTKNIDDFSKGEVKAKNGVIWSATSVDGKSISKGTKCIIVSVEGNTLKIKEIKGDDEK